LVAMRRMSSRFSCKSSSRDIDFPPSSFCSKFHLPDYNIVFSLCLTSSHNLPPSEANTGERGVCWGHPRPRQEASPPAPLIRETSNIALTGHINGLLRFLQ